MPDWVGHSKRRISFKRRVLVSLFWAAVGFGAAVYFLDLSASDDPPARGEAGGVPGSGAVEIVECGEWYGNMAATIEVSNRTSRQTDYLIHVAFESPDGSVQYDTAVTVISRLEPGQTATDEVIGFGADADDDFVCRIADEQSY